MFGFSFSKLLLLALLIFIVWTAFKYMRRVEAIRRVLRDEMQRRQAMRRPPPLSPNVGASRSMVAALADIRSRSPSRGSITSPAGVRTTARRERDRSPTWRP